MRIFLLLTLLVSACSDGKPNIAIGTLERDRVSHTATSSEVIVELPIKPGSFVKKGTVLVRLDTALQQSLVNKADADVSRAEANLEKLRHGAREEEVSAASAKVAGARAALVESRANYTRISNLKKQKLVSQAELDKARAQRDASQASLRSAKEALLVLTNGTREEDLRIAEAELDSAVATLSSEKKRLSNLTVVSERDGILDNLPWNLGERVTKGSPLAIVLAGKAPFARVYVPEPYRVRLKVGDELRAHVDGIDRELYGKIRWIATEPAFTPYYALNQYERARLMYLAEVQLPDSEAALPSGIGVQVELP